MYIIYGPENLDTGLLLAQLNQYLDNKYKYKGVVQDMLRSIHPTAITNCPIRVEVEDNEIVRIKYVCTSFTCAICQEEGNANKFETPCGHFFHRPCIQQWFKTKSNCPMCRQELT